MTAPSSDRLLQEMRAELAEVQKRLVDQNLDWYMRGWREGFAEAKEHSLKAIDKAFGHVKEEVKSSES